MVRFNKKETKLILTSLIKKMNFNKKDVFNHVNKFLKDSNIRYSIQLELDKLKEDYIKENDLKETILSLDKKLD